MPDWAAFSMGEDAVSKPNSTQPTAEGTATTANQDGEVAATTDGEAKASSKAPTSVWRCIAGSAIAAFMGYGAYNLTFRIATQFATHPLDSDNYIAVRLSGMVRTLVMGTSAMATGILAFAAIGLAFLGLQITLQKFKSAPSINP